MKKNIIKIFGFFMKKSKIIFLLLIILVINSIPSISSVIVVEFSKDIVNKIQYFKVTQQDTLLFEYVVTDTVKVKPNQNIYKLNFNNYNNMLSLVAYTNKDDFFMLPELAPNDSAYVYVSRNSNNKILSKLVYHKFAIIDTLGQKIFVKFHSLVIHSKPMNLNNFFILIDSISNVQKKILDNYDYELKKSSFLKKYFYSSIYYYNLSMILDNILENYYYKRQKDTLLNSYVDLILNNDSAKTLENEQLKLGITSNYLSYIRQVFLYRYFFDSLHYESDLMGCLNAIDKFFKGRFRDLMLFKQCNDYFYSYLDNNATLTKYYEVLKYLNSINIDHKYLDVLIKKADNYKKGFEKPISNKWLFKDVNGKNIRLSDYKGKYVYVNFWATWCSACWSYFDIENQIFSKIKNKNLVFVNIALESSTSFLDWKKIIRKKKLNGIQLYVNVGLYSQLTEAFNLTHVPTFIVLDKSQKIINYNAPFPVDSNFEDYINSLIKN
jgi:thiol-disulfide isomerase/thioredoxin